METIEHRQIKSILKKKLDEWLKASIEEYENDGHKVDVYAVTNDGITIDVEVIWSPSTIRNDINLLHEVETDVKIIIVSPDIRDNKVYARPLEKFIAGQSKKQFTISKLIDGAKVLNDPAFVDGILKESVLKLVDEAQGKKLSVSEPFADQGKIIWRISYPRKLPLFAPPMRFPIDIAIRNDTTRSIFCELIIKSTNKCLFFQPLQPIKVPKKR